MHGLFMLKHTHKNYKYGLILSPLALCALPIRRSEFLLLVKFDNTQVQIIP